MLWAACLISCIGLISYVLAIGIIVNNRQTIKPKEKLIIIGFKKIVAWKVSNNSELIIGDNKKGIDIPASKAGIMLSKKITMTWKR